MTIELDLAQVGHLLCAVQTRMAEIGDVRDTFEADPRLGPMPEALEVQYKALSEFEDRFLAELKAAERQEEGAG